MINQKYHFYTCTEEIKLKILSILITPTIDETSIEACFIFLCCDVENYLHDCLRDNVEQPPICQGNCSTSNNIDKNYGRGEKPIFLVGFCSGYFLSPCELFMIGFQWVLMGRPWLFCCLMQMVNDVSVARKNDVFVVI